MPDRLKYISRKARKQHLCYLCNDLINLGETYIYEVYTDCGDMWELRMHVHCDAIAYEYCKAFKHREYNECDIWDWAVDAACHQCKETECDERGHPLSCQRAIKKLLPKGFKEEQYLARRFGGVKNEN